MNERIVITGMGIVTGAGIGVESHHKNLLAANSQFFNLNHVIEKYDFTLDEIDEASSHALVCPVSMTNKELAELAEIKIDKKFDRHQFFSFIAANEAMRGFKDDLVDTERYACVGATGGGGLLSIFDSSKLLMKQKRLSTRANLKYLPNLFVGYLAKKFNLRGASHVHGTACAASMHALFDMVRMIKSGEIDGGLVVGTEAAISGFGIASFNIQNALGNGLAFQSERSGFVMGEGAAALLVERESIAKSRGANILAVIAGYGESTDGDTGDEAAITDPYPVGAAQAIRKALKMSGVGIGDIDLVKTHGTATPKGDLSEVKALSLVDVRDYLIDIPIVSLKSHFGHLLGAAGVAEIVSAIGMMNNNIVIPTKGLDAKNIDSACSNPFHLFQNTKIRIDNVLCNGFGFGGTNASCVISKYS